MEKVLSIIIPCYNCEETIEKTLNSIISIENIEIILVDDGSKDSTKKTIQKYLEHPNIKYLYQENAGPGCARNNGISNSTGKYIMFLDSDDYVETENLKELIDIYLLNDEYDIIYYNFDQVSETEEVYTTYNLAQFKECKKNELVKNTISWNLPWGQFKIIRRSIIVNNEIYFDETINNAEELIFTIRAIENSEKIAFFDKVIYHYLKRNDSISREVETDKIRNITNVIIKQLKERFENTEYQGAIYNYKTISNIHLLKTILPNRDYKEFKNICKEIRKDKKKVECNYIAKRYRMILNVIACHLDFLLYIAFKFYFRGK